MTTQEYQQRRDAILKTYSLAVQDLIVGHRPFDDDTEASRYRDEAKQAIDNLFLEMIETVDLGVWASESYFAAQKALRQELRNIIKGDQDAETHTQI